MIYTIACYNGHVVDFDEAKLPHAQLEGCQLQDAKLLRSDLTEATLDHATLEGIKKWRLNMVKYVK